jgi:predicted nucleic acid-binding protein
MKAVIFDASALDNHLCRVDPEGDIIEYISASYDGEPCAVMIQIDKLQHCEPRKIRNRIKNGIFISDEEVIEFIMQCGSGVPHLDRVKSDPYDFVILAYHKNYNAEILISCDRYLLYVAEHLDLKHRCFKAALHEANNSLNSGIVDDPAYHTEEMFESGNDPFFHYPNNRYCGLCDKRKQCICHR